MMGRRILIGLAMLGLVAVVVFFGYTVVFGFRDAPLDAVKRGVYGDTPTLTDEPTPTGEWYVSCPDGSCTPTAVYTPLPTYTPRPFPTCRPTSPCPPTAVYVPLPTYTPRPFPTCRPTPICPVAPTPTAYPTATEFPEQP